MTESVAGAFLVHVSLHGLVRGSSLELGCNADTGGQVKFVIELARQCASNPRVGEVLVVTRQIVDDSYSVDYAEPSEQLGPKLRMARLQFGPTGYIPKESLWPHLEEAADQLLELLQSCPRQPDALHAHYADAAYVCTRVGTLLGIPMVLTTHSLGKLKRERLLAQGQQEAQIDELFSMRLREEAEERGFEHSAVVFTSTEHERDLQCALYDSFRPEHCCVLAPGVHLPPPIDGDAPCRLVNDVERFLRDPSKPPLLMVARPAVSKNAVALVNAFGESVQLRQTANLVLVLGCRDDLAADVHLEASQVLTQVDKPYLCFSAAATGAAADADANDFDANAADATDDDADATDADASATGAAADAADATDAADAADTGATDPTYAAAAAADDAADAATDAATDATDATADAADAADADADAGALLVLLLLLLMMTMMLMLLPMLLMLLR